MMAHLIKEHDVLSNKVRFIQGVISEELKINRVKRKILILAMVEFGLKPMSKVNEIMAQFAKVGPQAHAIKTIKTVANDEDAAEEQEVEGEVPAKEFEYLLGMPMWSVTEERVDQLTRQM